MDKFLIHQFLLIPFMGGLLAITSPSRAYANEKKVIITEPENNSTVTNPFKVCMEALGLIVEPSDGDPYEGRGHHHILFSSLPKDLTRPLRRKEAIHLSKGEHCVSLNMEPGKHVIIALFSYGDHVPYKPAISDRILVTVN
ncbi:MAG: DUF4399 domain-containing protein [Candidatus Nitronauta litoralis]|uniref:DUF4399 domain-containing protein n=1 Tax=Candidatus Nitronauta litoralis TaxID=2705533 RepID=A0A7T0BUS2_9BACT|nr:MAG: DUF4399 domain-containing protein [Candidatus Nitronauta litoralis]